MMDLAEFLAARLEEDEAEARVYVPLHGLTHRHAIGEPGWLLHNHAGGAHPHQHDPESGFQMLTDVIITDPARVLREVEAGRKILELHAGVVSDYGGHDFGKGALACRTCGVDDGWYGVAWPCPTLLAKAAVFSDHADYDESWKP